MGDYRKTLQQIADRVDDEGLKILLTQLVNDLEEQFTPELLTLVEELKLMTAQRAVTLEHKVDENHSRLFNKVHTLANQVAAMMYKIDDLTMLINNRE